MIVRIAEGLHGDVLDVGCGEGLLVERLAKVSRHVMGIDRDELAIRQAEVRTAMLTNASVAKADFLAMDLVPESYDLLTFVAVLHHMDLDRAPSKAPTVRCRPSSAWRGRARGFVPRSIGPWDLFLYCKHRRICEARLWRRANGV